MPTAMHHAPRTPQYTAYPTIHCTMHPATHQMHLADCNAPCTPHPTIHCIPHNTLHHAPCHTSNAPCRLRCTMHPAMQMKHAPCTLGYLAPYTIPCAMHLH
uniref:Uncharacterized protein n=1 Tax=Dunaliella tertiolecta TaxID=3047 RepID=A0A7S3R5X4_DUNTE